MWALSFSDGFLLGSCRFGQALKPGTPEISGESGVAMAEMDGIAVGAGTGGGKRKKSRGTPPRPARNLFSRQRRLPARWVTELYGRAKLIVTATWAHLGPCARAWIAIPNG